MQVGANKPSGNVQAITDAFGKLAPDNTTPDLPSRLQQTTLPAVPALQQPLPTGGRAASGVGCRADASHNKMPQLPSDIWHAIARRLNFSDLRNARTAIADFAAATLDPRLPGWQESFADAVGRCRDLDTLERLLVRPMGKKIFPHITHLDAYDIFLAKPEHVQRLADMLGCFEARALTGLKVELADYNEACVKSAMVASLFSLSCLRLTHLSLATFYIRAEFLTQALRAPGWNSLREIHLGGMRGGAAQLEALFRLPLFRRLEHLSLAGRSTKNRPFVDVISFAREHNLGTLGAAILAKEIGPGQLRSLDLRFQEIEAEGLTTLLDAGILTRVEVLKLRGNQLGDAGAQALMRSTQRPTHLREVDLRDNGFSAKEGLALTDFLQRQGVQICKIAGDACR